MMQTAIDHKREGFKNLLIKIYSTFRSLIQERENIKEEMQVEIIIDKRKWNQFMNQFLDC